MLNFNQQTLDEKAWWVVNYVGMPDLPKAERSHLSSERCQELKAEAKTRQFASVLPWTHRDKSNGTLVTTKLSDLEADHLENLLITQIHLPPAYKIAIVAELRDRWQKQGVERQALHWRQELDLEAENSTQAETNFGLTAQDVIDKAAAEEDSKVEYLASEEFSRSLANIYWAEKVKGQQQENGRLASIIGKKNREILNLLALTGQLKARLKTGRIAPMPDPELLSAQEVINKAAAEEQPLDWTERHDKCPEKHLPSQITLHCGQDFNVTFTPTQLKSELTKALGFDPFDTLSDMREHFWCANEVIQSLSKVIDEARLKGDEAKKLAQEAIQKGEKLLAQQAIDQRVAVQDRELLATAQKVMSENDARIKELASENVRLEEAKKALCMSLVKHQEAACQNRELLFAARHALEKTKRELARYIDMGATTASVPKKKGLWRRFWDGEMRLIG